MSDSILIIPDPHEQANGSDAKWRHLDMFLRRRRDIDRIVCLGDMFDLSSLCEHDRGTSDWHKRRLDDDLRAGMEGMHWLSRLANTLRANRVDFIEGNHEDRYRRFMDSDSRLATSGFPPDICAYYNARRRHQEPITYHPFKEMPLIDGIIISHYLPSGVMGRPISGERPAGQILRAHHQSAIVGHAHTLDYAVRTRADGTKICALVAGCFIQPTQLFAYAASTCHLWWSGVHIVTPVNHGGFDVESISMVRLFG